MTRKDFEAIAYAFAFGLILERGTDDIAPVLLHVARLIADHCATRNPRFDRNKFIRACGFETDGSV